MRNLALLLVASASILAGCAQDDPENIPLRGQWDAVTKLDSVTLNGMPFTVDMLDPEFAAMEQQESQCGEPVFTNRMREELELDWRAKNSCDIETFDVDGARVSATGQCRGVAGMDEFNPKFEVDIVQREQSYRMVVNMHGTMAIPGEGQHHARFIAVQEGTRIGDC